MCHFGCRFDFDDRSPGNRYPFCPYVEAVIINERQEVQWMYSQEVEIPHGMRYNLLHLIRFVAAQPSEAVSCLELDSSHPNEVLAQLWTPPDHR